MLGGVGRSRSNAGPIPIAWLDGYAFGVRWHLRVIIENSQLVPPLRVPCLFPAFARSSICFFTTSTFQSTLSRQSMLRFYPAMGM